MTKKLTCLLTITLLLSTGITKAQSFKDRFFIAPGFAVFTDVYQMPNYISLYHNSDGTVESASTNAIFGLSYFTLLSNFRYNLVNLSDNKSVSLQVIPAFSLSVPVSENNEEYVCALSIPIMVGFNTGNISTYNSDKNKGFGIALGYEYFNGGLFQVSDSDPHGYAVTTAGNFATNLSYRYWNKRNRAKEFSVFLGFGGKGKSTVEDLPPGISVDGDQTAKGGFHARLSWSTYLNY